MREPTSVWLSVAALQVSVGGLELLTFRFEVKEGGVLSGARASLKLVSGFR